MPPLRLAFAGTPELAAIILDRLLADGRYPVSHVYTQPDRPAGRGRKPGASPVKQLAQAQAHAIPLQQPAGPGELDPEQHLAEVDVLVVAAYGMLLPRDILTRPTHGCINVHTSLLPRWRGAAPIQRAIAAGDRRTGISIMRMDAGLDTGDILLQESCPILDEDTAGTLHDRLAPLGAECLLRTLELIATDNLNPIPQDNSLATYAAKISKAEAAIDWQTPAREIERNIRAFNPAPVAHTVINGQPMRIWRAAVLADTGKFISPGQIIHYSPQGLDVATGAGCLRILSLQLPGKKAITCREFYNARPDFNAR